MAQRTHTLRPRMGWIALLLAATIWSCAVNGSLAWLSDKTAPVTNTISPGSVSCEVEENFDGETKTDVKVKNTGDVDAYVRATVVVNWALSDGSLWGEAPRAGQDYTVTVNATDWFSLDGYYYCTTPVSPAADTPVLIQTCQVTENAQRPQGSHLQVVVLAEAIQAGGMSGTQHAVETVWPVDVDAGAALAART